MNLMKVKAGTTVWVVFQRLSYDQHDIRNTTVHLEVRPVLCTGRARITSSHFGGRRIELPVAKPSVYGLWVSMTPLVFTKNLKGNTAYALEVTDYQGRLFSTYRQALRVAAQMVENNRSNITVTKASARRIVVVLDHPKLDGRTLSRFMVRNGDSVIDRFRDLAKKYDITLVIPKENQKHCGSEDSVGYSDICGYQQDANDFIVSFAGSRIGKNAAIEAHLKELEKSGGFYVIRGDKRRPASDVNVHSFRYEQLPHLEKLLDPPLQKDYAPIYETLADNLPEVSAELKARFREYIFPSGPLEGMETNMPDKHDPLEKMRFNAELPIHTSRSVALFKNGMHETLTQAARESRGLLTNVSTPEPKKENSD